MIFKSTHKYARISPTKVRRVAGVISGRPYTEALGYLRHLPHAGARTIAKVAQSAASNALLKNAQLDETSLYVKSIIVNEGPRTKRMWARARGRADVLLKRTCHVMVEITDAEKEMNGQAMAKKRRKK